MPIITAGYSEEANEFTAELADMVYAAAPNIEVARTFYADLKNRMPRHGRHPNQLKALPGIMPFIGSTMAEAEDKFAKLQAMIDPGVGVGMLALWNFPDLRGYDLDGPVPEVEVKSGRYAAFSASLLEKVKREKPTIRQLYETVAAGFWQFGCVGTPASIADAMEEWFTTRRCGRVQYPDALPARLRGGLRGHGRAGVATPRAFPQRIRWRDLAGAHPAPTGGSEMSIPKRTMRLGLLLGRAGCHPADWRRPSIATGGDTEFKQLARWAKVSEEARLDFIFLDGAAAVSNFNHPRMACNPEQGHSKLEPLTLAAALAAVTRNIGLVTTASTSLNHPFALAHVALPRLTTSAKAEQVGIW